VSLTGFFFQEPMPLKEKKFFKTKKQMETKEKRNVAGDGAAMLLL